MAYVNRPGTSEAAYEVTTAEIAEDIERTHAGHKQLAAFLRLAGTVGVHTRRFVRPLAEVARAETFRQRNDATYASVCDLGQRAARQALTRAGIVPRDIGTLITFHATGLAIPGLDTYLVNTLGLRPTVQRIPMSQLACAGGAHALGLAAQFARPGSPVLVVGAEALSAVYQADDDTLPAMIYKLLFGDGGAAAVVSSEPLAEPGLHIEDSWSYVHPQSEHYYRLRADGAGYHFDSTKDAVDAVTQVLPQLRWLHQPSWQPEFGVVHPGSLKILKLVAAGGGCSEKALRHSISSLREDGNTGGPAVLRVLERVHADPPPRGSTGLLFGVGPGFCAAASRTVWAGS
ncbi:PhlD [Streptomyces sp. NPDC005900]|uniref:PhlD n=1 Tax=Streptomyces sp. NPDC005900 TaxID=3154569 RepID=UPI0033D3E183